LTAVAPEKPEGVPLRFSSTCVPAPSLVSAVGEAPSVIRPWYSLLPDGRLTVRVPPPVMF
jgi:hypothetical protein